VCIRLEPFTEADIDRLIDWVPSEEFLRQWAGPGFDFPLGREQLKDHLAKAALENPDRLIYKTVDAKTGEVVGHGEILSIDRQNRSATIGRILVGPPEMRGRGVGQQIVGELLGIAFRDLSLHRLVLRVLDFNKGAIRCYENAGFRQEGLLRDVYKMGDEYWSLCVMSILEEEWRAGI
jgi:RimJ/RimL family protein N-acetyltransferase